MQAWREGVFRLLGDVLGRTLEVDHCIALKEILTHGTLKILRGKVGRLPKEIPLKVGDLQVSVILEEEIEDCKDISCLGSINNSVDVRNFRMQRGSCRRCEDDSKDRTFQKFKI